MPGALTGAALQVAARQLGLTQAEIAYRTGLSLRTINRLFNMQGQLAGRPATVEAVATLLGLAAPKSRNLDPLLAIYLPLETLLRTRLRFPGLHALLELSWAGRSRDDVLAGLPKTELARLSVVEQREGDLVFASIGHGIRWAGPHMDGARTLDLPDRAVGRVATERYWKALITGTPLLQYVRTSLGLEFTALTVSTKTPRGPSLVTVTALGRPTSAHEGQEQ